MSQQKGVYSVVVLTTILYPLTTIVLLYPGNCNMNIRLQRRSTSRVGRVRVQTLQTLFWRTATCTGTRTRYAAVPVHACNTHNTRVLMSNGHSTQHCLCMNSTLVQLCVPCTCTAAGRARARAAGRPRSTRGLIHAAACAVASRPGQDDLRATAAAESRSTGIGSLRVGDTI